METSPFSEFDLVSHPDRTLFQHLAECDRISAQVLETKHLSPEFYTLSDINYWRHLVVWFHDFGKGTDYFQHRMLEIMERMIRDGETTDFIESQREYIAAFRQSRGRGIPDALRHDKNLGSHAKFGAYYLFATFSHENPIIQAVLFKVIQHHHGHLSNFLYDSKQNKPVIFLVGEPLELLNSQHERLHFELYNKILSAAGLSTISSDQWDSIKQLFTNPVAIKKWEMKLVAEDTYRYFFLQHYLFSLLLSADKGDMQLPLENDVRRAIIRKNHLIDKSEQLLEAFKSSKFKNELVKPIDLKREQAFKDVAQNVKLHGDQSFFSITLPTGMGKTFAAFKAAFLLQKQFEIQTGTTPHIVYCLPFTSVIDQNAGQLGEIFDFAKTSPETFGNLSSDWISVHHYLSPPNEYYDDLTENQYELGFQGSEYMTEGWEQDVIATTFVQFLESIFTNRNRALRKFHNLVHSVVVLDEVQAIPPKYFEAVEAVFRHMSQYFGTKFLFVTATQPMLFSSKDDIIELTDPTLAKTNDYFSQMQRIQLDLSLLIKNDFKAVEDELEIQDEILTDILANQEKSFLIICNTIKQSQTIFKFLKDSLSDESTPIRYLSSSIIPYCRKRLITEIKKHEGRQILVSTQVVEAGVDIDFDVVYRDFAPLDSINQSAGRCNRNGKDKHGKGIVRLFHSGKSKFIYDPKLLSATKSVLQGFGSDIIPEEKFLSLNNQYAAIVKRAVAEDSPTSDKLKRAMKHLCLEDISNNFQLIDDSQKAYPVFIPYKDENVDAQKIWDEYKACYKIENSYERKAIVKRILPRLLPFVTRFQAKHYEPPEDQKKENIIFDTAWKTYYNEVLGFTNPGSDFY